MNEPWSHVLRCGDTAVGTYVHRPPATPRREPATPSDHPVPEPASAPLGFRPYLHPVRTLGGVAVTELRPADHPHHLGVGMAVPDVSGHNFWGGRTFVRGQGPTELDNHGVQRHLAWLLCDPDGFVEELSWDARDGQQVLLERRTVAVRPLNGRYWALDFTTALTNTSGEALSIGSPATNGRPGAGYGGFFWRPPIGPRPPRVFTRDAEGEEAVHGSTADWVAMTSDRWTLVFARLRLAGQESDAAANGGARGADPWFVRAAEYPGVGSALAWDRRLEVAAGDTVTRRIVTAVADGPLDRADAERLADRLHDKESTR